MTTSVPKTVLAALVENKVYPDPYYGLNIKSTPGYQEGRWLFPPEGSPFGVPWWYRTEFEVPKEFQGKQLTLHLDGINYEANVWLNGKTIATKSTVCGMFRRFEFPVTAQVRPGEKNALAIEIIPPGQIERKAYRTKQIQATTGWDDHNPQPPDLNAGIWEDVYLTATGSVAIRNPYVETNLETPSLQKAALTLSAFLRNETNQPVKGTLQARIESMEVSQEVSLLPNETKEVFFRPADYSVLNLDKPRIWWPHPLGSPELYSMDMSFAVDGAVSDKTQTRFGVRRIETYINEEDWRQYVVNGRKVLIRGGAWMTSDMMLNLSKNRYRALVGYAREGNLNMLRSEGFSIRETDDFYDACDEMGVMVTQQIFGRSIPDEALAVACIEDTMLRIRSHPSLAHFLGHDETFPTETLDAAYRDIIEKHRVNRSYQPHSGTFEVATRRATGGTRTGTLELWTYAMPSHYYLRKDDGAWGFAQSGGIGGILAAPDSLTQMLPKDQLWPPLKTEAWSLHTVIQGGGYFEAVQKNMDASYGAPADFQDFCRKAYAMNYNSARGMFEAYGRNKYSATGITTWKYDAAWPAAMTWQYIDWYLRPTSAYFGAKKACEGLHIQYAYDDESIWVINGLRDSLEGLDATAILYSFDLKEVGRQQAKVNLDDDGKVKAFPMTWPANLSPTHFLKLELRDKAGELRSQNLYWLSTSKDIPGTDSENKEGFFDGVPKSRADFTALNALPPAKIEMQSQWNKGNMTVTLTNSGTALAFQIQLALTNATDGLEIGPTYWSDNYFSLLPGESRILHAVIPGMADSTTPPTVRVGGWNIR